MAFVEIKKEEKGKIIKEYSKFKRNNPDNNEVWYSDFTSSVSSLRGGYVSYTDNLTPVKSLDYRLQRMLALNTYKSYAGKEERRHRADNGEGPKYKKRVLVKFLLPVVTHIVFKSFIKKKGKDPNRVALAYVASLGLSYLIAKLIIRKFL